jgi:hypothetical protein
MEFPFVTPRIAHRRFAVQEELRRIGAHRLQRRTWK